jgi:integrase
MHTVNEDIERFLNYRGFLPVTKSGYRFILNGVDDYFHSVGIAYEDVNGQDVLNYINSQPWGDCQQYKALSAIKSFVRWRFGCQHSVLTVHLPKPTMKPQRTLTRKQLKKLLDTIDLNQPSGLRDYAIITLAVDTGLRKAELCRLELRHVDLETCTLSCLIKGNRWGKGVFSDFTADAIRDWLSIRKHIAMPDTKTLFCSCGGSTPGLPLTPDGLGCVFKYLSDKVGFTVSSHDLRRTFATLSTLNGGPTEIVRKAGRWENGEMVSRYTQAVPAIAIRPFLPMANLYDESAENKKTGELPALSKDAELLDKLDQIEEEEHKEHDEMLQEEAYFDTLPRNLYDQLVSKYSRYRTQQPAS